MFLKRSTSRNRTPTSFWLRALYDSLREQELPLSTGLGKHTNDLMVSFYYYGSYGETGYSRVICPLLKREWSRRVCEGMMP